MPKIVLFGKDGQLGSELVQRLATLGELKAYGRAELDLCNLSALKRCLDASQADMIVNAAAYTQVDRAEVDTELADVINHQVPQHMAAYAAETGSWLVHYSTDYVFDGHKDAPYREDDSPSPLNVYGRSKLAGELAIAQSGCRQLILRTSWVYALHGQNFAKTMLRLAMTRDRLRVIDDQFGVPTSAAMLADLSALLLYRLEHDQALAKVASGLYHVCPSGVTSWCGYARFVLAAAERAGHVLKVSANEIEAITSSDYPTAAPRPMNSRLDCRRFTERFGIHLPDWRVHLNGMLAAWLGERPYETAKATQP